MDLDLAFDNSHKPSFSDPPPTDKAADRLLPKGEVECPHTAFAIHLDSPYRISEFRVVSFSDFRFSNFITVVTLLIFHFSFFTLH